MQVNSDGPWAFLEQLSNFQLLLKQISQNCTCLVTQEVNSFGLFVSTSLSWQRTRGWIPQHKS